MLTNIWWDFISQKGRFNVYHIGIFQNCFDGENIPLTWRKYILHKSFEGWYSLNDLKLLSLLLRHSGIYPLKFKRKQSHEYYTFHIIPRKVLNKSTVALLVYNWKYFKDYCRGLLSSTIWYSNKAVDILGNNYQHLFTSDKTIANFNSRMALFAYKTRQIYSLYTHH